MAGTVYSTPIGVESLVMAKMTDEILETYGAVTPISPLINIKISPKSNSDSLYADNRVVEKIISLGDIDIEIEVQDLPLEVQADMLGHTLDATKGVMTYNVNDVAPYIAIGFKIKKSNGKYRYVWLLKGKFEEMGDEASTQEDKVNFQTPKLKGGFVTRVDGNWKFAADDNSGTVPANFLEVVYSPTLDLIAPTVTSVPLDAAVGVIGTDDIVLTFDKAIQPSTIVPANVFVMKADGTTVVTTLTIGTDNTVVTIHPTTTLEVGEYIAVATTSVKATSGVAIVTNCVINFTV